MTTKITGGQIQTSDFIKDKASIIQWTDDSKSPSILAVGNLVKKCTSDWFQNDDTKPNHVFNRTHYVKFSDTDTDISSYMNWYYDQQDKIYAQIPQEWFSFLNEIGFYENDDDWYAQNIYLQSFSRISINNLKTISFNDRNAVKSIVIDDRYLAYFGNLSLLGNYTDSGEDFLITISYDGYIDVYAPNCGLDGVHKPDVLIKIFAIDNIYRLHHCFYDTSVVTQTKIVNSNSINYSFPNTNHCTVVFKSEQDFSISIDTSDFYNHIVFINKRNSGNINVKISNVTKNGDTVDIFHDIPNPITGIAPGEAHELILTPISNGILINRFKYSNNTI